MINAMVLKLRKLQKMKLISLIQIFLKGSYTSKNDF